MNDDVREIVARAGMEAWGQEFSGEFGEYALHWDDIDEAYQMSHRLIANAILAALADKGRGLYDINAEVKVDRERFERQRNVTEAAYEWVNSPLGDGVEIERVEKRLVSLVDALQPGDLDPIPERGE